MKTILIAGCGYVGTALGRRLAEAGYRVIGLSRDPVRLPPPLIPLVADLSSPPSLAASLAAVPDDLHAVFYTAAADGPSDGAYRQAYVEGVGHLLGALRHQGQQPQRIFFTSSTAVYAQSGGEWVDENSPTEPDAFAGKRLLEGETLFLESGFPATVVRLGGIYGPGRTQLRDAVARGSCGLSAESPQRYSNRIHRDDAAGALVHLLRLPNPQTYYLGVDHEPASEATLLTWLAQRLGVPLVYRERGEAPASPRRTISNKRASNARLRASGYVFTYPTFREGYAALIER